MREPLDLKSKTIVVTGANSGIGYEAALNFAQRGATVAIVCRDSVRGNTALQQIKQGSGNDKVQLFIADFSRLKTIPTLARQLLESYPSVDVLCNNAGSVHNNYEITDEGFEWTFVVNHLSNFVLTQWLLPRLLQSGSDDPVRIVFTSSVGHRNSAIDFDDLNLTGNYSILTAYGRSKLMNILTARELQQRHSNIVVSSFHPGVVSTGIWKHGGFLVNILSYIARPFVLNAKQGAETLVWLATSNDQASRNANGDYFYQCRKSKTADFATDEAAAKLWQVSLNLAKPYLPSN
jgi:NAD(P)-dependent dehydrogenase (short-subunit alcohol dehydrogenase family)